MPKRCISKVKIFNLSCFTYYKNNNNVGVTTTTIALFIKDYFIVNIKDKDKIILEILFKDSMTVKQRNISSNVVVVCLLWHSSADYISS